MKKKILQQNLNIHKKKVMNLRQLKLNSNYFNVLSLQNDLK